MTSVDAHIDTALTVQQAFSRIMMTMLHCVAYTSLRSCHLNTLQPRFSSEFGT